ncbi:unnamed protein product [Meloidogyne enterolobii]|uniref:Uncharacterized protein n=1 Tax=Meloidogyne enterolobii TaxID=390850 RepID=A0ACB0XXK4_MELEN
MNESPEGIFLSVIYLPSYGIFLSTCHFLLFIYCFSPCFPDLIFFQFSSFLKNPFFIIKVVFYIKKTFFSK